MAELQIVLSSCLQHPSFIKLELSTAFDHSLISVTVEHGPFPTFDLELMIKHHGESCTL